MTDIHGGRVLAGEDSEEDEEEDEAYSFQFGGGFGSQSGASTSAPRFAVPSIAAAPQAGGEESDEEDEEEEERSENPVDANEPAPPKPSSDSDGDEESGEGAASASVEPSSDAASAEGEATASTSASSSRNGSSVAVKDLAAAASPLAKDATMESGASRGDDEVPWSVDSSMNGPQMMADAFVRNIQPSLDATIQRIEELRSSQTRLLQLLVDQNASVASNKQIEDAAVVLDKLPHYFTKIQMIRAAMTEISASTDKMKRRAESLRIDAQSYALKKENKRDAQSQWNKLYAAKSSAAPPSASRES